jgi:hypothetical protein
MGEQHEPHINTINIWVYYGVYMGFMLLTHHKHLGLLWCLYGVCVSHPSQTSGFIMVFIWGLCCSPITHITTIINPDVCDG